MIGPLFFSVVEATLDRGYRSGLAVASGIWVSDTFFILVIQKGLESMKTLVAIPDFRFWAGVTGGIILIAFGALTWIKGRATKNDAKEQQFLTREKGLLGLWLRGFAINTINPGTLIFWLGTGTGIVAPNGWSVTQISIFFGAMMAVLVTTDILKVYGAKYLRNWLTPDHILMVRRSIGLVLVLFGVIMLVEARFE